MKKLILIVSVFLYAFPSVAQETEDKYYLRFLSVSGLSNYNKCDPSSKPEPLNFGFWSFLYDSYKVNFSYNPDIGYRSVNPTGAYGEWFLDEMGFAKIRPKSISASANFGYIKDYPDGQNEVSFYCGPVSFTIPETEKCYRDGDYLLCTEQIGPFGSSSGRYVSDPYFSFEYYSFKEAQKELEGENSFCADGDIRFQAGNDCLGLHYKWEYSKNNTTYIDANVHTIGSEEKHMSLSSLPNYVSGYDGNIFVRARISFDCGVSYPKYTNRIVYTVKPSAPKISNFQWDETTSCSYTSDAKFWFTLDGDKIIMYLKKKSNPEDPHGSYDLNWGNNQKFGADNTFDAESRPGYLKWPAGLEVGEYQVKYQTSVGEGSCVGYQYFTIKSPKEVTFTANKKQDVSCPGGNDGKIVLSASGGTNSFRYSLNNGAWNTFPPTQEITGLKAATYTIKVRDTKECVAKENNQDKVVSITINQPREVTFKDPIVTNPIEHGGTGSIELTIEGLQIESYLGTDFIELGSSTYKRQQLSNYSFFSQNFKASNLPDGQYQLIVKFKGYNNAECNHTETFTIISPPKLTVNITKEKAISCQGYTGQLRATANGGVPFSGNSYNYAWQKKINGSWSRFYNASGVAVVTVEIGAGTYRVIVKDQNEVSAESTFELNEPSLLEVKITNKQDVHCYGGRDGWAEAKISGGNANYEATWSLVGDSPKNNITHKWLSGVIPDRIERLKAGTYSVIVTDSKGCPPGTASVKISQPEQIQITPEKITPPTLAGGTNGSIKVSISGGTKTKDGKYLFLWDDSKGIRLVNSLDVSPEILNSVGAGIYSLTILDVNWGLFGLSENVNGCVATKQFEVEELKKLEVTISVKSQISCNSQNNNGENSADGSLLATATGGVELERSVNQGLKYYYVWKKKNKEGNWDTLKSEIKDSVVGLVAGDYAVNVKDANGIIVGEYNNNELQSPTDYTFHFEEPPLLEVTITKQDDYCHGGGDGWAKAKIIGGTKSYKPAWADNKTNVLKEGSVSDDEIFNIENLVSGTYFVNVVDSKGCKATESVEILQPKNPIKITYSAFSTPSKGGASDGWVEAQVSGGTTSADGSYTYTWTTESEVSLNSQTKSSFVGVGDQQFGIRLSEIPKGLYYLNIEDANYETAKTKEGCRVVKNEVVIYDPIEATIEEARPISCNQKNQFHNPYSDGKLRAKVTGGLPFSEGNPYIYHWKKQDKTGSYLELVSKNSDSLTELSAGKYALNVEDSRGVVIGNYNSATLVKAEDSLFTLDEPFLLVANITSTPLTCKGNDGEVEVTIAGGTPEYQVEWTNGEKTNKISNLVSGNYTVRLLDARGCEAIAGVDLGHPGGLEVMTNKTNPTCFLGQDGKISLIVTGGKKPYSYHWSTGAKGNIISNLVSGTYMVQVTDNNNCITVLYPQLEDPKPVIVNLGEDRTLCNKQSHKLDIAINDSGATYRWESSNGFFSNSSTVSLTDAGIYTATLTTGKGCVGTDEIEILTSSADIDSEFLVSSQVFAKMEIILINVSNPMSTNLEWILPKQAKVIDKKIENVTFSFDEPGSYEITLRSFRGKCFQDITKLLVVEKARDMPDIINTQMPLIQEFITFPNTTNGSFTAKVKLAKEATISLRLYGLISNTPFDDRMISGHDNYEVPYSMSVPSGLYVLLLETANESQIRKIIIR